MKKKSKNPKEIKCRFSDIEDVKNNVESVNDNQLKLFADIWHSHYRDGLISFDQKDYRTALNFHLKALKFNEYVVQERIFNLLMSIGIEYEKLSEFDQAISYYKKLLKFDCATKDDKSLILKFIGQCFDKKGDEKSAYTYFCEHFSQNQDFDNDWYLFYRYARLSYKYRDFENAQKYFIIALEKTPKDKEIYIQSSLQFIGYTLMEKGLYKESIINFKKALKLKTKKNELESEILSSIAHSYFSLNRFNQAIKYSKKAIAKANDDEIFERSYFLLAFCYSIKKDKYKEQCFVEKLQRLRPDSPYLKELL